MKFIVTCPTYKRKYPKILKMLETDNKIVIHFGVRQEEYESGFYDEWKQLSVADRIKFILLKDCKNIADTRNALLKYAHELDYDYVIQLDDTVTKLKYIYDSNMQSKDVINLAINRLLLDKRSPIGCVFVRPGTKKEKLHKSLIQAWIVDVKRLFDTDIRFEPNDVVGWDDFVFSWKLNNAHMLTIGYPEFRRIAKSNYPWANQPGGTHVDEIFDVNDAIKKNNYRCELAKKYLETTCNAKNISIKTLSTKCYAFNYVHARWK